MIIIIVTNAIVSLQGRQLGMAGMAGMATAIPWLSGQVNAIYKIVFIACSINGVILLCVT